MFSNFGSRLKALNKFQTKKKASKGILYIIKSVIILLDKKDAWKIILHLIIMSFTAIFNAVGITMVVPFVLVATTPHIIFDNHNLAWAYHFFHFSSTHQFLITLGLLAISLLVVGNLLSVYVIWQTARISYGLKYKWLNALFAAYLSQPYIFFLYNSTSELSKNLLHSISRLTDTIIIQLFDFFAKSASILAILLVLVAVNPLPAIGMMICLGIIYFVIFNSIKNLLKKINLHLKQSASETFKVVEEAFNTIKEVKLYQKESVFLKSFELPIRQEKHYMALSLGLAPLPRYILEIFAFGSVLLLVLYLLIINHNLSGLLPILGFFIVALYRIMPLTQNVFSNLSMVLTNSYAIEEILQEYQRLKIKENAADLESIFAVSENKIFSLKDIELNSISFKYPSADKTAVKNLNLKIKAGSVIGFVGPSGAGKTTIIDIILGLLHPDAGSLIINGECIDTIIKRRYWQGMLGYVPQSIILTNNNIAQNIAFGVLPADIDMQKVEKAAQFAKLDTFIDSLPDGYSTFVGDRGIRLSGGQRQRIGIARALYNEPSVLIFDEATNALDGLTEMEIMQSIHSLSRKKTIIIIAHRLQTIRACDRVFYIDHGQVAAEGSYDDLVAVHEGFKKMVQIADDGFSLSK